MAGPLATALITVGKQIVVDIVSEPENILKYVLIVFGVILFFLLLILFPLSLLFNFPLLSFDSADSAIQTVKTETIGVYRKSLDAADEKISVWINDVKESNTYDDCTVSNDFSLDWRLLMIIDAVRFEQDYSNVSAAGTNNLAYLFADRDYYDTTYNETVTLYRPKLDSIGKTIFRENGMPLLEPYEDVVEKKRLVINISEKSFETVLDELNFSKKDLDMALLMYNNLEYLNADGELLLDGGN